MLKIRLSKHLSKTSLISILLILLPFLSYAQGEFKFSGQIIDEKSKEELVGASILIKELNRGVNSNINGQFSFEHIPMGSYHILIQFLGYESKEISIDSNTTNKYLRISLKASQESLKEAIFMSKTKARTLKEQAFPISVISMKELRGTVSSVQDILLKTVGLTLRQSGGVGSSSRISLRGLEGKRIGFFIDEVPLNEYSDYVDINDIPVDMIERIEIYKGIVPAKFGGSSMGGAVNLVIRKYPERYADLSYSRESYNVNKAQSILKRNISKKGILLGLGGAYTSAQNNYVMQHPFLEDLFIERKHDRFKKAMLGGNITLSKGYFDEIEIEPVYVYSYREIQGIFSDYRKAFAKSNLALINTKIVKDNFLLSGLDLDVNTAFAYTKYSLVDTARYNYDWRGNKSPSISPYGGELPNRFPSNSNNKKLSIINKSNLNYFINSRHSININSFVNLILSYPQDSLKAKALNKQVDFNSKMLSWVIGATYDFKTKDDRFLNSLTSRFYLYSAHTTKNSIYTNASLPEDININKTGLGISDAFRYKFTRDFMLKYSMAYDLRLPSENELLGDGINVSASQELLPERNLSFNLGFLYSLIAKHSSNLQIELNMYYMNITNMIHYEAGLLGAQYQNFGKMRSMGVEFEAKADILPYLYTYFNISYQDLRDTRAYNANSFIANPTKGKRIPNIPFLLSNIGFELHKENLFGGHGMNSRLFNELSFIEEYFYDFEVSENQKRRIPRSIIYNIGCEQSFFNQSLFISASIKNVTNAKIVSELNQPLVGRSFGIKLRYIFK